MKRLIIIFACLVLFNANGQTKPKFGGLKGCVKQVLEENFKPDQNSGQIILVDKLDYKGKRPTLKIFDKKGNCIRVISYTLDNKIRSFYISEFDSLECGSKVSYFSGDSHLTGYILNKCDKRGNDSIGIGYDKNNNIVDKYIWHYNENNLLIETLEYKFKNLERKTTYQNDKFGNQIEIRIYSAEDSLIGMYKNEFDSIGNKIIEMLYSKENLYSIKHIKYNNNQNITEELTYNTQGKLIEKINYEYKYDEKGNWIERLELNSDIPQIITTRKIHYCD